MNNGIHQSIKMAVSPSVATLQRMSDYREVGLSGFIVFTPH